MINWFDMPAEGLSNGGQFEIKELTATENKVYQKDGEVYNKVTVNVEGGGGEVSWVTVFNDSVTTEETPGGNLADLSVLLTVNVLKVTLNGTEYICRAYKIGEFVFYGGYDEEDPMEPDFSEFPFEIVMSKDEQLIIIQNAGTYTLKIEEPTI